MVLMLLRTTQVPKRSALRRQKFQKTCCLELYYSHSIDKCFAIQSCESPLLTTRLPDNWFAESIPNLERLVLSNNRIANLQVGSWEYGVRATGVLLHSYIVNIFYSMFKDDVGDNCTFLVLSRTVAPANSSKCYG